MSESDSEYATKEQFIEAVRDDGAELDGLTYFTEGEGSATTYYSRNEDGEEEQVTKSEIEAVWDAIHGDTENEDEEDEGPEEVHLGTFYFSKANWDTEQDRETLEDMLEDAGWYIDGEVDSGGYRIKTEQ